MNASVEFSYESLPRKRMGSGVVFTNARGEVLLVNPTYKDGWELPGGVVEEGESPRAAAGREAREELGLDIHIGQLICVDDNATDGDYLESLMFLFAGPTLGDDDEAAIRRPLDELSEWRWCSPSVAVTLLRDRVGRRLESCLRDGRLTAGLYLEDQHQV